MSEHKFKAFLQSRQWNENQNKKFVDLVAGDPDFPDAKSWQDIEAYLTGTPAETVDEAKYIWVRYMAATHG